jgi:Gnt-I system high-affinity gluconate transporter/Gnt-II system L-idonate transporter
VALIILSSAVIFLLVLIAVFKLPAYISLIVVSIITGIANGMNLQKVVASITSGIGSTLGSLILILAFGVMLGAVLSETGAVQKISKSLISFFGIKKIKTAMVITGFIVGIAMFYNAGFIVLMPLVFSVASYTGLPLVYLACATASALSVTHGFLPPHPGPTAIAIIFKADINKVLLYGFIVAVPSLIFAGIIFPEFLKKIKADPPAGIFTNKEFKDEQLPSFAASFFIALIPFLLMAASAAAAFFLPENSSTATILKFTGDPNIAMLIAVLSAIIFLGIMRGISIKTLMDRSSSSLNAITIIILITAAGGAFRQILTDSGTGTAIADYFQHSFLSPLFLGWFIATVIRISVGSATVAGLTAAGICAAINYVYARRSCADGAFRGCRKFDVLACKRHWFLDVQRIYGFKHC